MAEDLKDSSQERNTQPSGDAVPRAFVSAADHLLSIGFLIDFVLGLASIALGTWYFLSGPSIAVLFVAVSLAAYVLVHVWRHFHEHPRRARKHPWRRSTHAER